MPVPRRRLTLRHYSFVHLSSVLRDQGPVSKPYQFSESTGKFESEAAHRSTGEFVMLVDLLSAYVHLLVILDGVFMPEAQPLIRN